MEDSHRNLKKEQTRQALIKGAYELFAEKGYASTTLADITRKANCAPRTFFRYFRAKEDLLLVYVDQLWDDLAQQLDKRGPSVTTLEVLKTWSLRLTLEYTNDEHSSLHQLNQSIKDTSLSVDSRKQLYSMERMREILAKSFAQDLGKMPDDQEPHLVAAVAAAVLDAYHYNDAVRIADPVESLNKGMRILEGAIAACDISAI